MIQHRRILVSLAASLALCAGALQAESRAPLPKPIEAQPLTSALKTFAQSTGLQLVYVSEIALGLNSNGAPAGLSAEQTLSELLSGTGLTFEFLNDRTVSIRPAAGSGTRPKVSQERATDSRVPLTLARAETAASEESPSREQTAKDRAQSQVEEQKGVPEILVKGSKMLNMDIARTRSDAQPYVIFDRQTIEDSGAVSLEDFFRQRLNMSSQATSFGQSADNRGGLTQVNLRGLGTAQTLILVDGHRRASPVVLGARYQPDLNGIPLSAIERIEVLSTTASGIYGGGATGGAINIILRRDYVGMDASVGYENTYEGDVATKRAEFGSGFSWGEGTSVIFSGAFSDRDSLLARDRDFIQRGRATILANNPSFFYGAADPVLGATPNIRSVSGAPLTLKFNNTPLNSAYTFVPNGYTGIASDNGLALVQNAGRYNFDLAPTGQGTGALYGLTTGAKMKSLSSTLRHRFSPRVESFVELAGTDNSTFLPMANLIRSSYTLSSAVAANPFQQNIRVTVPIGFGGPGTTTDSADRRIVGGVIVKLGKDWMTELDYTWNRMKYEFSQLVGTLGGEATPISQGTIQVLRDPVLYPVDVSAYAVGPSAITPSRSTLRNATLRTAGTVWTLPAGAARVSTLLEWRDEGFAQHFSLRPDGTAGRVPARAQSTKSAYAEVKVPLFAAANRRAGIEELELQVAVRRDEYEVNGSDLLVSGTGSETRTRNTASSTDPTIGLRYTPFPGVMLRASWGTGFMPPEVHQLVPNAPSPLPAGYLSDPRRNGEPTPAGVISLSAGNPNLTPEESESRSFGLVWQPNFVSGLRVSLDYTRIKKDNNINIVPPQTLLDYESVFSSRIQRAPVQPGDPYGVGVLTQIDFTYMNIAQADVEAYDLQLDYDRSTAWGDFRLFASGTWMEHFLTRLTPQLAMVENVGVSGISLIGTATGTPLELRYTAGLSWQRNGWLLGWTTRYFDSYLASTTASVLINQGNGGVVESQMFHDLNAGYSFDAPNGWRRGLEIKGGIKNVFNTTPAFDANGGSARYISGFADPYGGSVYVNVRKSF